MKLKLLRKEMHSRLNFEEAGGNVFSSLMNCSIHPFPGSRFVWWGHVFEIAETYPGVWFDLFCGDLDLFWWARCLNWMMDLEATVRCCIKAGAWNKRYKIQHLQNTQIDHQVCLVSLCLGKSCLNKSTINPVNYANYKSVLSSIWLCYYLALDY